MVFRASLVFLFCSLFSFFAFAGPKVFAGEWHGQGTYILDGKITNCSVFELIFSASGDKFQFVFGKRECDDHDETFYPVTITHKDGLLYFNGKEVGTYSDNVMTLTYQMPEGDTFRNWRMSMRREGDHLMYEESRTMEGEKTPLISFAGVTIKK